MSIHFFTATLDFRPYHWGGERASCGSLERKAEMFTGLPWLPTQVGHSPADTALPSLSLLLPSSPSNSPLSSPSTTPLYRPKNWHHQLDHRDKEGGVFGAGRQCHALVPALGGPGTGQGPAGTGAEESSRCQLPRSAARGNRVG